MTMTRETDANYHYDIEDAIAFMLLCERGFGVGSMEFFDGAMLGYRSVFNSITEACGGNFFGAGPDHWRLANDVKQVRGAMLTTSSQAGIRMVAIGANELDVIARHKLAKRPIGRIKVTRDDTNMQFSQDKLDPMCRIVEVRAVAIQESGAAKSLCKNYYVRDRKQRGGVTSGWNPTGLHHWIGGTNDALNYEATCFGIGACAATLSRLWWRVLVRFGGQRPGIQLFTDATGVKDFFRFREIPEGRNRRDALVHWVSDHWRQNRVDPDVESYVREHLRGSRGFDWHNLTGTIELPDPEIKRAEDAIEFRKELRRKRRDRRRRLMKWKS